MKISEKHLKYIKNSMNYPNFAVGLKETDFTFHCTGISP